MTRLDALLQEAENAPEALLNETLDFLRFLKSRRSSRSDADASMEAMLLSESSLAKDWLRPEEDEAWQDL